jgi:general stress protein 26
LSVAGTKPGSDESRNKSMDKVSIMDKLAMLIEDSRAGVLSTVNADGFPAARWMTPAILKDRPNELFCVTCPGTQKAMDLGEKPHAHWTIQNRTLTQVVTVTGKVNILDNPAIKAEIMEAIGHRLEVFWKANCDQKDFVVLETVIEEATYFRPMQGTKETVKFQGD